MPLEQSIENQNKNKDQYFPCFASDKHPDDIAVMLSAFSTTLYFNPTPGRTKDITVVPQNTLKQSKADDKHWHPPTYAMIHPKHL